MFYIAIAVVITYGFLFSFLRLTAIFCGISISLQPFTSGPKYSKRCLDLDYNDICMNIDQAKREGRGSVSYTDYYSTEDGLIRRSANDSCLPIFMKPGSGGESDGCPSDNPEDEEEHTLTLKQTEEQKKQAQDLQQVFEKQESPSGTRASGYKKIGR